MVLAGWRQRGGNGVKACDRCGKCCRGSPCGIAERYGMKVEPYKPCPALRRIGAKYYCGLVLDAKGKELEELRYALKIGEGCHLW